MDSPVEILGCSFQVILSTLESNQRLIEESDKGVINDFDEQLIKDCRKCAVNRLKVAQNVKTTEMECL